MNIEDLKSIMDAFDPASLLPEMEGVPRIADVGDDHIPYFYGGNEGDLS